VVLCAAIGWVFARPLLRLRGHYFAIATFVFALLAQAIENNWESLTRGTNGLPGIPPPSLVIWTAQTNLDNYFLALGLLVISLLVVARVVHSPFGRSLIAVRDDDRAAASVGVEVGRVRTIAFVLAAAIAGAGGALYAQYTTFVSAQPFGTDHMITILAAAAIGGMGTTMGPVAGAALLTVLPEVLRGFSNWRMVIFGALVIVVVLVRPDGLAGLVRAIWGMVAGLRPSSRQRAPAGEARP
jgi:ABC-type branched-subunit amino acid transport system permease subunit